MEEDKDQDKGLAEAWEEAEWEALVPGPVRVDIVSARIARKELCIRLVRLAILSIVQNVGRKW